MRHRAVLLLIIIGALALASAAAAQTPVPFPKPGQSAPAPPKTPPPTTPPAPRPAGEPTQEMLGAQVYPGAQYIASYDAGGAGQRFHLYGTNDPYVEIVAFYKKLLRKNGDELFNSPGVHMFETARYREESMAFPPSVTVKDYSWGGSGGYLNPKRGAQPARFRTIIQIVPPPAGVSR
jgi:hypothetical protein